MTLMPQAGVMRVGAGINNIQNGMDGMGFMGLAIRQIEQTLPKHSPTTYNIRNFARNIKFSVISRQMQSDSSKIAKCVSFDTQKITLEAKAISGYLFVI